MILSIWLKRFLFLVCLIWLPACGTLQVEVEAPPTRARSTLIATATVSGSLPSLQPTISTEEPLTPTAPVPTPTLPPELLDLRLHAGQPLTIVQIHMADQLNGWALGQVETDLFDHILFTLDGGRTWQDRTPLAALLGAPAQGLAADPYFSSASRAWVAYNDRDPSPRQGKQLIWFTSDEGQTWNASEPLDLEGAQQEFYQPAGLHFLDDQHGWLMAHLGAGMSHDYIAIFTTSDGGRSWQRVVDPDKNPELMGCVKTGLAFSTAQNALLVGDCPGLMPELFLYATYDGGQTWSKFELPPPEGEPAEFLTDFNHGCGVQGIEFTSSRRAVLSVLCRYIDSSRLSAWLYVSTDGGHGWTPYALPAPYGSFDFVNATNGWFLGSASSETAASAELYQTTNSGQSWTPIISTGWKGIVDATDLQRIWVVAASGNQQVLAHSEDGGNNWQELNPVVAP